MPDMERVPPEVLDDVTRVPREEVEEGEEYIFSWYPYSWAYKNEGMEGRVRVTVTDVSDFVGDIEMRTEDGTTLTDLGEGRVQVMGPARNTPSVSDWTDVGRGGIWYEPPDDEDSASASSLLEGRNQPLGPLPGGIADRLSGGNGGES